MRGDRELLIECMLQATGRPSNLWTTYLESLQLVEDSLEVVAIGVASVLLDGHVSQVVNGHGTPQTVHDPIGFSDQSLGRNEMSM